MRELGAAQFDASFLKALQTKVSMRTTFKGHLDTYRFCDNVRFALLAVCACSWQLCGCWCYRFCDNVRFALLVVSACFWQVCSCW